VGSRQYRRQPFRHDVLDSYGRSLPWIRFVLFYAAVTSWLVTGERDLRLVGWWMAAVLVAYVLDTLVQYFAGISLSGQERWGQRLTGVLDRPNMGIFLAKLGFPTFAVLAWFCARGADRRVIAAAVGVCTLVLVTILLSGERTATLLTLLGLVVVLAWVFVSVPHLRVKTTLLFLGLAGTVTMVVALVEHLRERVLALVDVLSSFGESPYGQLFTVAYRAFVDNPLTGVGLKSYRLACPKYESLGYITECMQHPHNIYLEWLSEGGLITFAVFVMFVVSLFVALLRLIRQGPVNPVSAGFLAGALLVTFFPFTASQSFLSNWPAILLWFSVALTMAAARVMAHGHGFGQLPLSDPIGPSS
jgi:O-antigen ligase